MSEIVCPSCKSRYQIPDGAIGPAGRKVNCSNCSHVWLAIPEPEPAMETAGAEAASGEAALRDAFRSPGEEPAGGTELESEIARLVSEHTDEASGEDNAPVEDPPASDDLMPEALRPPSEPNRDDETLAADEAPAADPVISDFGTEVADVDDRYMPAEPQAGPPPYSGEEAAYAEHADEPVHGLEPYADDEEPVVYDEEPDEAETTAPAVTVDPDASDGPRDAAGDVPDAFANAEEAAEEVAEEDPTEIAARALAMAESPVENMRRGQMAEIRQMLDELQTDGGTPAPEPDAAAETTEVEPDPIPARPYEEDEYRDPLKERLAAVSGTTPAALKQAKKTKDYDRDKLIKRHQRRYRRKKIAEAKTRPNAFAAGFMLIVMVAALMTGIYLLHPQIIARVPGAEPALMSYVQMIDGFRGLVAEKMDALRLMVEETAEKAK